MPDAQQVGGLRPHVQHLRRTAARVADVDLALLDEAEVDELPHQPGEARAGQAEAAGDGDSGLRSVDEHLEEDSPLTAVQARPVP